MSSTGWKPNVTVAAVLHSDPIALGTLTADGSGAATGRFSIPANVATGNHTVELEGQDPAGLPRTVSIPITVSTTGGASGVLAFTGTHARDLISVALLMVAVGLFVLGRLARRRDAVS